MIKFTIVSTFCAAICILSACRGDNLDVSETSAASFGDATETFYNCQTATQIEGSKSVFEVAKINNTLREISLNIVTSKQTQKLRKKADQLWENETFALRLGLKQDGSKSIQVHYKSLNATAAFENGYCKMFCGENAQKVGNSCLAAGGAPEDPIGNAVIETIGTLGASGLVSVIKFGTRSISLVSDKFLVEALRKIPNSSYDEAIVEAGKVVSQANPLALNPKTIAKLRGGNCGNEAITQIISFATGRWACAIPYPEIDLNYARPDGFVESLDDLLGVVRQTEFTSFQSVAQQLATDLAEGQMAMLQSAGRIGGGEEIAFGHATVVLKLKGRLVHINNQLAKVKFQDLSEWSPLWEKRIRVRAPPEEGFDVRSAYRAVIVRQKMLGYP